MVSLSLKKKKQNFELYGSQIDTATHTLTKYYIKKKHISILPR